MLSFKAKPLEKFSSLHFISIPALLGIKSKSSSFGVSIAVNFNLATPIKPSPQELMTFHLRDSNTEPAVKNLDFCITNLSRWRLDISSFKSFASYLQKMNRKHYTRFSDTQETFKKYGAKISVIEKDWSEHVDTLYPLYIKVATKHGTQLYDIDWFRAIAKLSDYKLICAWHEDALIGALVLIDEQPIFHSICCGLDYDHSSKSHAYSQLHYEFIRLAIESNKFTIADIGPTANEAKACLDFKPVSCCMDVWAHNRLIRGVLRLLSTFMSATINSQAKLKLNFHSPWRKPN